MNSVDLYLLGLHAEEQKDYQEALCLYEQAAGQDFFPAKEKVKQMKDLIKKQEDVQKDTNLDAVIESKDNIVDDVLERMVYTKRELCEEAKEILIVNAGRMNHGKSSLLNSLLGNEVFEIADVRKTRVRQKEKYAEDVYVIDTPGLDADAEDDAEAFEVYKKANYILFVHSLKIGELHKSEIDIIVKLEKLFPKGYFWDHFAMVLTFGDAVSNKNYELIKAKIQSDLDSVLPDNKLKIFFTSNKRFEKGVQEESQKKKETFIKKSGIPILKEFIDENLSLWREENLALQKDRFNEAKAKSVDRLEEVKNLSENRINQEKTKYDNLLKLANAKFSIAEKHLEDKQKALHDFENNC
ncbi:MAG: 50S ribosome-binding GTPase [Lachnospiraceae bacterium]|nr:50S ribosome-binding GTPase [Lachnospiraceae bacterium]